MNTLFRHNIIFFYKIANPPQYHCLRYWCSFLLYQISESYLYNRRHTQQSCSEIIKKTVKIGVVWVSTSNVKLFLETISSA